MITGWAAVVVIDRSTFGDFRGAGFVLCCVRSRPWLPACSLYPAQENTRHTQGLRQQDSSRRPLLRTATQDHGRRERQTATCSSPCFTSTVACPGGNCLPSSYSRTSYMDTLGTPTFLALLAAMTESIKSKQIWSLLFSVDRFSRSAAVERAPRDKTATDREGKG